MKIENFRFRRLYTRIHKPHEIADSVIVYYNTPSQHTRVKMEDKRSGESGEYSYVSQVSHGIFIDLYIFSFVIEWKTRLKDPTGK